MIASLVQPPPSPITLSAKDEYIPLFHRPWLLQTTMGEAMGKTSVQTGHLLKKLGLRDEQGNPTKLALKTGLACQVVEKINDLDIPTNYWKQSLLWKLVKASSLSRTQALAIYLNTKKDFLKTTVHPGPARNTLLAYVKASPGLLFDLKGIMQIVWWEHSGPPGDNPAAEKANTFAAGLEQELLQAALKPAKATQSRKSKIKPSPAKSKPRLRL